MTSSPETALTLEEIATLADGTDALDNVAWKLAPLVRSHPRLAGPIAELEAMAQDARVAGLRDAVDLHHDFDRLAAAQWQHPAEVLDPDAGISYPELIAIASARAGKARGAERRRLLGIRERLELAYADYRGREEFFEGVVDRLLELDQGAAEGLLKRLTEHHRFRRENPEWKARSG